MSLIKRIKLSTFFFLSRLFSFHFWALCRYKFWHYLDSPLKVDYSAIFGKFLDSPFGANVTMTAVLVIVMMMMTRIP